jgi:hypothetical protein
MDFDQTIIEEEEPTLGRRIEFHFENALGTDINITLHESQLQDLTDEGLPVFDYLSYASDCWGDNNNDKNVVEENIKEVLEIAFRDENLKLGKWYLVDVLD